MWVLLKNLSLCSLCPLWLLYLYFSVAMKLPELKKPDKYIGLYVVDFGDHSGVGFTAAEVAELLDSEKFKDCKVYKIHNAYPDGQLELKGIPAQAFQLEAGMFFYSEDLETAHQDFKKLTGIAVSSAPPCRSKVHLAKYNDRRFVVALIYPAEYDDELSKWLLDNNYKTAGAVEGGTAAVTRYYQAGLQILERHQLFAVNEIESRTGEELLAATRMAIQR